MPKKTTSARLKSGPLSREEKKNIEDWAATMDATDMARRLSRPLKIVEKYKREYMANAPAITVARSEAEEFRRELHAGANWGQIKQQYTHAELVFYENQYIEYRRHYKDMTAMELTQLHQLLNLDVLINKHNIERKRTQDEVDRLEKLLDKLHARDYSSLTQSEKDYMRDNENMLMSLKATNKDRIAEHKNYHDKHNDLMKALKSTRDQRVKISEDQGKWMTLLYELEIRERRSAISTENALAEMAKQRELERLSQPFQYGDGMIDQPVLNYQTNNGEFE